MSKLGRTLSCPKCGSVLLQVIPAFSKIDYVCSECNEYVASVDYREYETLYSDCKKCGNDTFKVRIAENEESKSITPFCSKCSEEGLKRFTDKEGRTIDAAKREIFILRDIITELAEEADSLENNLNDARNIADYAEVINFDETIYTLKMKIGECNDKVSSLNDLVLKLADKFDVVNE